MTRIGTLAAVLLLGTVVGGSAAKAQTTIVPNSAAGVPALPGTALQPPLQDQAQSNQDEDQDGFFHQHRGIMGMMGLVLATTAPINLLPPCTRR
jgi:hypothetical protein